MLCIFLPRYYLVVNKKGYNIVRYSTIEKYMNIQPLRKNIFFLAFLTTIFAIAIVFTLKQLGVYSVEKKKEVPVAVKQAGKSAESSLQLVVLSSPVYIKTADTSSEVEVMESVEVKNATIIRTGEKGRAELRYPNKSVTRLNFNSKVEIKEITKNPQTSLLRLLQGSIWNRVTKLVGRDSFRTETGFMVATVRGTAYRMGILPDGTNLTLVAEGTVNVSMDDETYEVDENRRLSFNPDKDEKPKVVDFDVAEQADEWTDFNLEQDKQWMEQNSDVFKDNVLGAQTQAETSIRAQATTVSTPELINCTGPDGVNFRATKLDCDNLNSFWNAKNPPAKTVASNSTSQSGSSTSSTATPTAIPTAAPTAMVPSPTIAPVEPTSAPLPTATNAPPPSTPVPTATPQAPPNDGGTGGTPEMVYRIYLVCVEPHKDNTYTAYFDYELYQNTPVFLFISKFEGGEGNPPATLTPDNNRKYIPSTGRKGQSITWIADNVKATANFDGYNCVNIGRPLL